MECLGCKFVVKKNYPQERFHQNWGSSLRILNLYFQRAIHSILGTHPCLLCQEDCDFQHPHPHATYLYPHPHHPCSPTDWCFMMSLFLGWSWSLNDEQFKMFKSQIGMYNSCQSIWKPFEVFAFVQVGCIFGCCPTFAFGMLVRGVEKNWSRKKNF